MKKWICLILSFALTLTMAVVPMTAFSASNIVSTENPMYTYTILADNTIRIVSVDSRQISSYPVVIPETLDGYTVTMVGGFNLPKPGGLVLPKTVKHLYEWSFEGLYVGELYLPEELETISYHIYDEGDNIVIPRSVTSIEMRAFGWGGTPTTLAGQPLPPGTITHTPGFTVYSDGNEVARAYAESEGHDYVDLSEYARGDMDLNAYVNMMDALTVLSIASGDQYGTAVHRVMAGVDRNDTINMMDALLVYREASGE